MKFIDKHYTNTLEVKQSKFITHLVPYKEYESTLNNLKTLHSKARHFVVAYRYLNNYNQIVEHSSDDGEPKGTSGKPSLIVLQGHDLINTVVIIVRYFGGTKLGTGGLVRAYSEAVNLSVDLADLYEYKEEEYQTILFSYSDIRKVEYECNIYNIEIIDKSFTTQSVYKIKSSKENMSRFLESLNRVVTIYQ